MTQPSTIQNVDYGRGKAVRRTSRLALCSAVASLLLWLLVAANVAYWRAQPPPLSGFAGVGWFFGMLGLFGLLVAATLLLAPLSFALGIAGLRVVRSRPDALRGGWLARLGICLSLGACLLVTAAKLKLNQLASTRGPNTAAAGAGAAAATTVLPPERYPAHAEQAKASTLVRALQTYASRHNGRFPNDLSEVRGAVAGNEAERSAFLSDFVYCGAGLTQDPGQGSTPPSRRQSQAESLILVISRHPLPGMRWVVGLNGHPHRSTTLVVSDEELGPLLDRNNRVRAELALPPIDFDVLLQPPRRPAGVAPPSPPAGPQL